MASKKMDYRISMECTQCKERNYFTFKNKKLKDRLELKKHCKRCKKHTVHKENK